MIAAGLLKIKTVLCVVLWESLSSYVIHDVSKLDERQESLAKINGGLLVCQPDYK
jgi:hypothetical protein